MLHTCSLVISNNYPKCFKLLHHLVWRVELVIFYFSVIGIDLNSVVLNFLSSILGEKLFSQIHRETDSLIQETIKIFSYCPVLTITIDSML